MKRVLSIGFPREEVFFLGIIHEGDDKRIGTVIATLAQDGFPQIGLNKNDVRRSKGITPKTWTSTYALAAWRSGHRIPLRNR
jgi:hypothetical protein